jgi:hypothetical protein
MTEDFTEWELGATPYERARKADAEHARQVNEAARKAEAKREAFLNEPRKDCDVFLKDPGERMFSRGPVYSLHGNTNGRSVAEAIDDMKRSADKARDSLGWTHGAIVWRCYAVDDGNIRDLGSVVMNERGR